MIHHSSFIIHNTEFKDCMTCATFSSIGCMASIQWMVKPRRSIPLNHVIWRLANWWMAISNWLTISS